ncbi:MAG: hypothetical protein ACLFU9_01680 [Candidatus Bathyarchaeia archaeon]
MADVKAVKCPEYGCQRVWKTGLRHSRLGEVQRYLSDQKMGYP